MRVFIRSSFITNSTNLLALFFAAAFVTKNMTDKYSTGTENICQYSGPSGFSTVKITTVRSVRMSRDSVDMQISRVISCIRCPSMTFPQSAALLVCSSLYHSALCLSGGSAEKCLYFSFATSMSKQNSFFPAAISEKWYHSA